jgi:hypothetical protein
VPIILRRFIQFFFVMSFGFFCFFAPQRFGSVSICYYGYTFSLLFENLITMRSIYSIVRRSQVDCGLWKDRVCRKRFNDQLSLDACCKPLCECSANTPIGKAWIGAWAERSLGGYGLVWCCAWMINYMKYHKHFVCNLY